MANIIITKLTEEEIQKKGIKRWPIWEKEISIFDWNYEDTEECLILEGEAVIDKSGKKVEIKAGDFVTFESGLKCVWDIKVPIRKYYHFK